MTKLDEALGLFPSCIKSGENWSSTCQSVLDKAKAELAALRLAAQPQSPRKWDEGEHEGCGIDTQRAVDRAAVIEQCAKIAENCFGGKAHTYSSENADMYRVQDAACGLIAAKIRALSITRPVREGK
jgi:hypothetical protein